MITGFCSVAQENQEKIYDYSGCVYPEGYLSSNQVCLFDHDQIEKIFFLGFEDEEEVVFKDKLNKIVASIQDDGGVQDTQQGNSNFVSSSESSMSTMNTTNTNPSSNQSSNMTSYS